VTYHQPAMNESGALDPRDVVNRVLSSPSLRVEALLRRRLSEEFPDARHVTAIVEALAQGQTTEGEDVTLTSPLWRISKELRPYAQRRGSDATSVTFWPEDFPAFFVDLALALGIDVHEFGRKLQPDARSHEYAVGRALTVLAQIEGIYEDVPGALTETRVPRRFLYVVASALIGMVSGSAADNPVVNAAIGGVGGLLLDILASRFETDVEPQTDFLEDLILRVLEEKGKLSTSELIAETHMTRDLVASTLRRLLKKKLIRRVPTYVGGKTVRYDLAER
jgi:hypothetical protein